MISFRVKGGEAAAEKFLTSTRWQSSESLGGVIYFVRCRDLSFISLVRARGRIFEPLRFAAESLLSFLEYSMERDVHSRKADNLA